MRCGRHKTLIKEFVSAGFEKIHIDTSMRLAGDEKNAELSDETIAQRGACLCEAAEKTYEDIFGKSSEVLYVLGSEVPVPGGTGAEEEALSVTSPEDFKRTYYAFEKAFKNKGLEKAFGRVMAFVVQPGVEFGVDEVQEYDGAKAADLMGCLSEYPGMAFEGHSTDYQTYKYLCRMARDGVRILKVGPELTFSLREALFALDMINKQLSPGEGFAEAMEKAMTGNPAYWEKYYGGTSSQQKLMRKFSYSDRWRYYAGDAAIKDAVNALFESMDEKQIPLPLLSQFLPKQYEIIRNRGVSFAAEELAKEHIKLVIDKYYRAVSGNEQVE